MDNYCNRLKEYIELTFSMPFVVSSTTKDGEDQYSCHPDNEGEIFFDSTVFIHNNVRVVVEILPQRHGGELLYEMSKASNEQKERFFDYIHILESRNAKIQFLVNGSSLKSIEQWPLNWKSFSCRITKIPLTDDNDEFDEFQVISEWMKHSICLIFSTLTITDRETYSTMVCEDGYEEGNSYKSYTNRYERNPINRELCLAKKGYKCQVCDFDFKKAYGLIGKQFIEVHHVTPVSLLGPNYKINVDKDLVPVCANCHAMLHRKNPPYTPEELKAIVDDQKYIEISTEQIHEGNVLMAITYSAYLDKTIESGKIAVGIKDDLARIVTPCNIKYILLHNWQNENSRLYKVNVSDEFVHKESVDPTYLLKYKESELFLMFDFNPQENLFTSDMDVKHLQPYDKKKRYDIQIVSYEQLLEPDI